MNARRRARRRGRLVPGRGAGSAVSAVRRAAERLGAEVGLRASRASPTSRSSPPSWPATWSSTPTRVVLLVRPVRRGGVRPAWSCVAIDSGPGMADLTGASRDGHSTAGTLGIGLGAIVRQAELVRRLLRCRARAPSGRPGLAGRGARAGLGRGPHPADDRRDGLRRRLRRARTVDGRRQVLVCDGLGHGPLAARPPRRPRARVPRRARPAAPAAVVEHLHRAMSHTRGAALAVAELDPAPARGALRRPRQHRRRRRRRRRTPARHGLAARHRRPPAPRRSGSSTTRCAPGAVLVMHSDGVADRWRFDRLSRACCARSPLVDRGDRCCATRASAATTPACWSARTPA